MFVFEILFYQAGGTGEVDSNIKQVFYEKSTHFWEAMAPNHYIVFQVGYYNKQMARTEIHLVLTTATVHMHTLTL